MKRHHPFETAPSSDAVGHCGGFLPDHKGGLVLQSEAEAPRIGDPGSPAASQLPGGNPRSHSRHPHLREQDAHSPTRPGASRGCPGFPGLSFRRFVFHKVKTNKKLFLKTAGAWFKVTPKDARALAGEGEGRPPAKPRAQALRTPLVSPDLQTGF